MARRLDGKTIAVLVSDGFEQVEMTRPVEALKEAGATVRLVSPESGDVHGNHHREHGDAFPVDVELGSAMDSDYDGLLIPGGLFSPDLLRTDDRALSFVKAFFRDGRPVAAICHGPQVLISAGLAKGRRMTGYKAIQIDLANAGATVEDQPVVTDQGVVTSRSPDDIDAFNPKMIEEFAEGRHSRHAAE
ncbi:type 1 glutamine amidotransferase domain-containing protein [Inquilinus sp. CAU 1745]|uniref:type 1 glutamine amidotransferase domain-containing protein n=1 Tax=Inquilinus sp. CAU 1745 TaxID=3140369 RepID=UPI00325A598F